MRSHPGSFHLSFLLPKGLTLSALNAAYAAEPACAIRLILPLVKIAGASREAVFNCATALLRSSIAMPAPLSIAATLRSPPPLSGCDSWSIIVGADVAFSPTSLDPHFPRAAPTSVDPSPTASVDPSLTA